MSSEDWEKYRDATLAAEREAVVAWARYNIARKSKKQILSAKAELWATACETAAVCAETRAREVRAFATDAREWANEIGGDLRNGMGLLNVP